MSKKFLKVLATGSEFDLKLCYYGCPYVQGHLREVPLKFEIFAMKVVGQTM